MPYMIDAAYDAALNYVQDNATSLHICSQEPATLAEAITTYSLGEKTTPTISEPGDRTGGGRKCTVSAITDGVVDGTDDASHWALVSGTELLAANALDATQGVTSGNPFTLPAFDFGVPDVVSD